MTGRCTAALLGCLAALACAGTAMADGGIRAWPSSAALAGAWSGTAASTTEPAFTFPVTATVAVSATSRPDGRVRIGPPVSCSGNWVPLSARGAVTTFSEEIVGDAGNRCIRDGRVQLSPATGGRLRYVWTKGDAGSVAYLAPVGLSGTWVGTIEQQGLGRITARIRVIGVRAGEMEGRTDYSAPLSCSGRLTPVAKGNQLRAAFHEQIVRSESASCIGSGTTRLVLRPDGRMAYRWTGGGQVSVGLLRRAA